MLSVRKMTNLLPCQHERALCLRPCTLRKPFTVLDTEAEAHPCFVLDASVQRWLLLELFSYAALFLVFLCAFTKLPTLQADAQ